MKTLPNHTRKELLDILTELYGFGLDAIQPLSDRELAVTLFLMNVEETKTKPNNDGVNWEEMMDEILKENAPLDCVVFHDEFFYNTNNKGDIEMKKVKEILTMSELKMVTEDCEQALYESFRYDGLVSKEIIESIKTAVGEDGLEEIARRFAYNETQRDLNGTIEDFVDNWGDNAPIVLNKYMEQLSESSIVIGFVTI